VLLGVDVGGTFTDAVLYVGGRLVTGKAPTTPEDQSRGVLDAVRLVLERAGVAASDVEAFAHGTTVATNALLEGRGARTALIATEGFEDVVELGRQARADLYRLCARHPAPLVPPELRVGAPGRMTPDGPLRPVDAETVADRVRALDVESVAVCLLHAYRHPEHELAVGRALAGLGVHVSLSHETVGTFREYERAATTEVDASLSPLLGAYLRRLADGAGEEGLPVPSVMQSSGGLAAADWVGAHAATALLSGPAGGAAGAAWAALAAGEEDVLCFDMGGTSCDVCVISGGIVRESAGRSVGGRPVALPMLDIHTVGAGGGSVGWRDAGGALRVGPRSAGARPGPACYGHGGTEPTVTDANVLLGHLSGPLAGGIELDRDAAERAVADLAVELGLDLLECARGIVDVANAEMVRALRVMTVERGVDPRTMALMAFGGAGGLHAAAIADELGIDRILCPRASGVLAALGLVVSERRRDVQRSVLTTEFDGAEVAEIVRGLGERAREDLGDPGAELRAVYDMRYRGQAFELAVAGPLEPEPERLRDAFAAAHQEAYGYRDPDGVVELVTVRVTAAIPGPEVEAHGEAGERIEGPTVVNLPEATLVVPEGWRGEVLDGGTIRLECR
jgi:N-methylhydantoinase A